MTTDLKVDGWSPLDIQLDLDLRVRPAELERELAQRKHSIVARDDVRRLSVQLGNCTAATECVTIIGVSIVVLNDVIKKAVRGAVVCSQGDQARISRTSI